ncbi:hypothetical protein JHK87_021359 [Glycine soja]|nr:hypothetical protein JHK87_021359 [Glycine soja]
MVDSVQCSQIDGFLGDVINDITDDEEGNKLTPKLITEEAEKVNSAAVTNFHSSTAQSSGIDTDQDPKDESIDPVPEI